MSSLLSAELAATCNALGYLDAKTGKYYGDQNTLETVKDLIRYLRRDDEFHDIRRHLGETKVLLTDLLPLLKSYWVETDLFDVLLRLIVNLTTPALILWNEELPTEKTTRNHYLQIEDHLQSYKEAFADESVWSVLSTRLSKILEIDSGERGDENSLIIERILILIRNILYVPADPMAEKRTDNDASVHDQVLWALHQSGMLDIMLYMTSSSAEQAYYMHLLEILSFMLREQKASDLASAALQRSQNEKMRDEAELLSIRNRENNQKRLKVKAYTGTRHSRFGGTYVVKTMKGIGDNDLVYHKPLSKALNFDVDKKKPKTPKNRLPMQGCLNERRSAFSVRLFLKEFCVEFLNGAYNTMMYHAKDNLSRSKAQAHDESYYLWAIRFFMEFNRCYKFEVKLVSETMSVQAFHYVQQQSENYFDLITTDKKKFRLWSRRLHLALLAYRELFATLLLMDKSADKAVRDSSRVLKSNIFYVLEYREFVLTLLVNYDELKMSDVYLKDLIETQHIFLKMLEAFCKQGTVMVQKKGRAKKKKKPSSKSQGAQSVPTELNLDVLWDEHSSQLSAVLEGSVELTAPDVVPFDAASDVPIDDQKADAMKNIQRKLRNGEYENAIGLLRAAREVWPENDSFGSNNMAPEEEFLALRDIFFADLGENTLTASQETSEAHNDEEEFDDEEEEEEEEMRCESDFRFEDFTKRLANPKAVRACGLALKKFDKNSVNTNHCIIKLLHRIAFDCKMYVMLFQVSIFKTFQRIFSMKEVPEYKELAKFGTYVMRQFFKVAEINNKVYMESLFWKSSRTAYDIEQGYGSYQEKSSASAKTWTEQEEDELRRLFVEHQRDHQEEDVVDWICSNLIDNTRTRRVVLHKLKEMCLIIDYKKSRLQKSAVNIKVPQNWGAEEETQLRDLFEHFQEAIDPLTCIMDRLTVKRPKNRIVEKLLVMGLIQDKSEMRKKKAPRGNKSRKSKMANDDSDDDSIRSGSGDESDGGSSRSSSRQSHQLNKINKKKPTAKGKHTKVSAAKLAKQLIDLVDKEMSEPLEWLKESISDAIEDYDDDDNEGIPLVPIMDYAVTAMENAEFQNLLKSFGVLEPFDEQESYWRIPGHLNLETLKSHCNLLEKALEKTLTIPEENNENQSSDDDDVFDRIKKQVKEIRLKEKIKESGRKRGEEVQFNEEIFAKKIDHHFPQPNDNSEDSSDVPEAHSSKKKINKRRIAPMEDSDDSNESFANKFSKSTLAQINESEDSNDAPEPARKVNKRKIQRFDDSEDSNDVPSLTIAEDDEESEEENAPKKKPGRIMDSDDEDSEEDKENDTDVVPINESEDSNDVPNLIIAEDDEEREEENVPKKKPGRIMDSDDEDSNEGVQKTQKTTSQKAQNKNKIGRMEDSDSEEDKENDTDAANVANEAELKRIRSNSSSDTEKPLPKRSRVLDSDDED